MHLITGGSGFVGSNIARMLHQRGEAVRVLDIWRDAEMDPGIDFVQADINDAGAVAKAMQGVRYVHHNVALVPLAKAGRQFWTVNVEGTRIALDAAVRAGVTFFSHMSSSAVYGSYDSVPITIDTPRRPVEAYGRAKLAAEELALKAAAEGLPVSVIRPRTIVGKGRLGIFEILFDWIHDNANIYIIGSGHNRFQFVHVEDLAEVSIQSCLQERPGQYNAGAPEFGTLRQDLGALISHAGSRSKIRSLPVSLSIAALGLLDLLRLSPLGPYHYLTYYKTVYFDNTPTCRALGWQPRYGNQEILSSAYDWFVASAAARKSASHGGSPHKRPVRQGILNLVKKLP